MAATESRSRSEVCRNSNTELAPSIAACNPADTETVDVDSSQPLVIGPSGSPRAVVEVTLPAAVSSSKSKRFRIKRYLKELVSKIKSPPYHEDWERTVLVEVPSTGFPYRPGIASIDTQCTVDLMSLDFAALLGVQINPDLKTAIAESVTGGTVYGYGTVKVRWACDQKNIPFKHRLHLDPKFRDGVFYITDATDRFNVIIGRNTIHELQLLQQDNSLIAPFYRSLPPALDPNTVGAEQANAKEVRQREEERMQRHLESKKKTEAEAKAASKP